MIFLVSAVLPVDHSHNDLDDGVLLLGPALGDEEGQGYQGVVGQPFAAVVTIEDAVSAKEIDEQRCCDSLVAVAESVILDDEVEEISPFLLDARVKLLAAEGLVDGPQRALETLIFLDSEEAVELWRVRASSSTV